MPVADKEKSPPPALVVVGDSEVMPGCIDVAANGTRMSQTVGPCVGARSVRDARCKTSEWTTTFGIPFPRLDQVAPASVVTITPASVPMYSALAISGSTTIVLTGMSGRLPLRSVQFWPLSVVLNTWPGVVVVPTKPEKVAYAVAGSIGSTTTCVTTPSATPTLRLLHTPFAPLSASL